MNLEDLEAALGQIVKDKDLLTPAPDMLNDTILELAGDFELPALKLLDPVPLTVDDSKWLWPMPDSFHKKLFMVRNSSLTPWGRVHIHHDIEDLNRWNPEHDTTAANVSTVATGMQGKDWYLGIRPLPLTQNILQLWFYRKPAILIKAADVPDCIPPEYHYRVIVVKTMIKNFRLFTDAIEDGPMKSLTYWEELYRRGLYGEARGDIGLVNYLAKLRGGPRRHGGRDPIGPGRFYSGYNR
jgi:hypothetical protein